MYQHAISVNLLDFFAKTLKLKEYQENNSEYVYLATVIVFSPL